MKIINHNGKPYVEGNVFMLPTAIEPYKMPYSDNIQKGAIVKTLQSGVITRGVVGKLRPTNDYKIGNYSKEMYQHLYITTDELPKTGEWYLSHGKKPVLCSDAIYENPETLEVENRLHNAGHRKIIASTDPKLIIEKCFGCQGGTLGAYNCLCKKLPQIPQSFIEDYCKAGGIDEVLVEYFIDSERLLHGLPSGGLQPKLNPDNSIIIHRVEDKMYSRKQVEELIKKFYYKDLTDIINSDIGGGIDKWIEENL